MSVNSTLDERYFQWLYNHIGSISNRNPVHSHILLTEQMFKKPFYGFVANDHNRAEDGKELREEYLSQTGERVSKAWLEMDCSIFEMLISLSRRASFQSLNSDWTPQYWFWRMVKNLELSRYTDERYTDLIADVVDKALDSLVQRTYDRDGRGGLFPLRHPHHDQTRVEIWYQLADYLSEND